ncbi:hypothetical protein CALCODRAFT_513515 [Calocera cornea HHB12733]|uniref:Uncharacterized protein n=1 Tax=Calocera cornea HHB12733 TaxID=1353952 RepID=A0A165C0R9_9BASI|nr:hypothetical protein CALCODRAFT_513515 [Calocera cornea HHB12733]
MSRAVAAKYRVGPPAQAAASQLSSTLVFSTRHWRMNMGSPPCLLDVIEDCVLEAFGRPLPSNVLIGWNDVYGWLSHWALLGIPLTVTKTTLPKNPEALNFKKPSEISLEKIGKGLLAKGHTGPELRLLSYILCSFWSMLGRKLMDLYTLPELDVSFRTTFWVPIFTRFLMSSRCQYLHACLLIFIQDECAEMHKCLGIHPDAILLYSLTRVKTELHELDGSRANIHVSGSWSEIYQSSLFTQLLERLEDKTRSPKLVSNGSAAFSKCCVAVAGVIRVVQERGFELSSDSQLWGTYVYDCAMKLILEAFTEKIVDSSDLYLLLEDCFHVWRQLHCEDGPVILFGTDDILLLYGVDSTTLGRRDKWMSPLTIEVINNGPRVDQVPSLQMSERPMLRNNISLEHLWSRAAEDENEAMALLPLQPEESRDPNKGSQSTQEHPTLASSMPGGALNVGVGNAAATAVAAGLLASPGSNRLNPPLLGDKRAHKEVVDAVQTVHVQPSGFPPVNPDKSKLSVQEPEVPLPAGSERSVLRVAPIGEEAQAEKGPQRQRLGLEKRGDEETGPGEMTSEKSWYVRTYMDQDRSNSSDTPEMQHRVLATSLSDGRKLPPGHKVTNPLAHHPDSLSQCISSHVQVDEATGIESMLLHVNTESLLPADILVLRTVAEEIQACVNSIKNGDIQGAVYLATDGRDYFKEVRICEAATRNNFSIASFGGPHILGAQHCATQAAVVHPQLLLSRAIGEQSSYISVLLRPVGLTSIQTSWDITVYFWVSIDLLL